MMKSIGLHIIQFFQYNFHEFQNANNRYLSFHTFAMLAGFVIMPYLDIPELWRWILCITAAITWECLEFIFEHDLDLDWAYINYDGKFKYWYDAVGDVVLPVIVCLAVEIF